MDKTIAIRKYEELLLGKTDKFFLPAVSMDAQGKAHEREDNCYDIIRYAITELLGWTPEEALECLTPEVAKRMKLDMVIARYVPAPIDVRKDKDFDYFVHKAFPREESYNANARVLRVYKSIQTGELKGFPRGYFTGADGEKRAAALLMHVLSRNMAVDENRVDKLYDSFNDVGRINAKLKEWKIYDVCRSIYSSPLEFLHNSLPEEMSDEFYYNYLLFMKAYKYHTTKGTGVK